MFIIIKLVTPPFPGLAKLVKNSVTPWRSKRCDNKIVMQSLVAHANKASRRKEKKKNANVTKMEKIITMPPTIMAT
jgi:hypothetical protein